MYKVKKSVIDTGDTIASLNKAITIDNNNVRQMYKCGMDLNIMALLSSKNAVHKVIAHNVEGIKVEEIFTVLIADIYDFFPINIVFDGHECTFEIRRCRKMLEKLIKSELRLNINDKMVQFTIILVHSMATDAELLHVEILALQIKQRMNMATGILNLDNYQKIPALAGLHFYGSPLRYLHEHFINSIFGTRGLQQIRAIKLSNNNITTLFGSTICNLNLKFIDLRNNQIENVLELTPLKSLTIKELWLDGNPLCKSFSDEASYMKAILLICPHLDRLDGVPMSPIGVPCSRRNYICSPNAVRFVDQFLEHFFTVYDNEPRDVLSELYHKDALFSLTASYLVGQTTFTKAKLHRYIALSHNLLKLSDLSRGDSQLYKGNIDVIACLSLLPKTEHDPYTFTVDVVEFTNQQTFLTITGVFRHPKENFMDVEESVFGFCRTFRLTCTSGGKYQITNDTLFVSNATTIQAKNAFKIVRAKPIDEKDLGDVTENDRKEMCNIVAKITGANIASARKCLEVANWDVKEALKIFLTLFQNFKINVERFN